MRMTLAPVSVLVAAALVAVTAGCVSKRPGHIDFIPGKILEYQEDRSRQRLEEPQLEVSVRQKVEPVVSATLTAEVIEERRKRAVHQRIERYKTLNEYGWRRLGQMRADYDSRLRAAQAEIEAQRAVLQPKISALEDRERDLESRYPFGKRSLSVLSELMRIKTQLMGLYGQMAGLGLAQATSALGNRPQPRDLFGDPSYYDVAEAPAGVTKGDWEPYEVSLGRKPVSGVRLHFEVEGRKLSSRTNEQGVAEIQIGKPPDERSPVICITAKVGRKTIVRSLGSEDPSPKVLSEL